MENLCRICLTREKPFFPIFAMRNTRDNALNLYEKIKFIGKIELAENDGLPSLICERCTSLVNMVHQFCELSQISDVRLREYYNKPLTKPSHSLAKDYFDAFSQTDIHTTCEIGIQATETVLEFIKVADDTQDLVNILCDEFMNGQSTASNKNEVCMQDNTTDSKQDTSIRNALVQNKLGSQRARQRRKTSTDQFCPNCKQNFSKSAWAKHICSPEKLFSCQFCGQTFTRETTVQRHAIQCMQKIETSSMIDKKLKAGEIDGSEMDGGNCTREESPNLYKCKECNVVFPSKHTLRKHLVGHNRKKYICCNCDAKFYKPDNLRRHQEKTGHNRFDEHQRTSRENANFVETNTEKQQYKCETCQKIYSTKTALERHMAAHMDSELLKCEYCVKTFLRIDTLKAHTMRHEQAKFYYCDKCTKKYVTQYQLDLHKKKHEKSKDREDDNFHRFLCHICSKTCKSQASLSYHMSTHTGYKPYVCKICGRGFTISSNLVNHERTHTGFKPFVCHYCSAQFATSSSFKCHLTTHTGEANYHCNTCGRSFKRLKYLKEHRFTHTGEKPFACKVCGASYSHSGSLFAHTKKCKVQYPELYEPQSCTSQAQCQVEITVQATDRVYAGQNQIT